MQNHPQARRRRRWLPVLLVIAAVAVVGVGAAAFWFQPWKLFTNTEVDEALPALTPTDAPPGVSAPQQATRVLAEGTLITHEHATTGVVKIVELPGGERVVRVEDLDTSEGPKLVVLLTDAPVIEGPDGWHVFESGRHVNLGDLKGNRGNANYPIPAGLDIDGLNSVSIWCDRFDVSFGAAALQPV